MLYRTLGRRGEQGSVIGLLRYIGLTGHKDPRIHLYMLEVARERGIRFDAVQMPLNVRDAPYRSFARMVLPGLVRDEVGVLGMKVSATESFCDPAPSRHPNACATR